MTKSKYEELFIAAHNIIKAKNWVPSNRTHNTGIGKTYEDLLGKTEDNLPESDFHDIEVKTQREESSSFVTLFTKSPDFPRGANTILRNKFGTEVEEFENMKQIHTSVFGHQYNTYKSVYGFSFKVDRVQSRIYFSVIDLNTNEVLSNEIYYKFQTIEQKLKTKLKNLAYVSAESRHTANGEEFKYTSATLYYEPSIEKFIDLLENGYIMIDIRIGFYKNPTSRTFGKTHDHGTGFRIKESDLSRLYAYRVDVK